jgi:hypothetical protein
LTETYRAFGAISDDLQGELRDGLEQVGKPVAELAEQFALSRIRNMTEKSGWAEMRVGVSKREALVYMVPESRGKGGRGRQKRKRKNLAELLMDRSMAPAAEENQGNVESKLESVIDHLSRENGF